MMKHVTDNKLKAFFATILAAAFALSIPAMAQSYEEGSQGQGSAQGSYQQNQKAAEQNFDDPTLDKFVSANIKLSAIQNEFAQKLQGVQDQEKATELQREMNGKMVKAVENEGLKVETYNAIASQVVADEQLKSKIELKQMLHEQEAGN